MSTHALASLTATYTDSEPEGEVEDQVLQDDKSKSSDGDDDNTPPPPVEVPRIVEPPPRPTTLVSYNDDAVDEDDDEGEPRATETPPILDGGVELPPEPTGRVSPRLVEKISKLYERAQDGMDLNIVIQNKKEFRNPSIYEKLIQFCGINELGTNYPPRMYDPLKWGKESYYDELAKVQKSEMDRREKEKKDKTKVEFVVGTKKTVEEDIQKKRKSKWDQVGSTGGAAAAGLLRSTGILQPAFTAAASGTKSTVISAFGSLPKKQKT